MSYLVDLTAELSRGWGWLVGRSDATGAPIQPVDRQTGPAPRDSSNELTSTLSRNQVRVHSAYAAARLIQSRAESLSDQVVLLGNSELLIAAAGLTQQARKVAQLLESRMEDRAVPTLVSAGWQGQG